MTRDLKCGARIVLSETGEPGWIVIEHADPERRTTWPDPRMAERVGMAVQHGTAAEREAAQKVVASCVYSYVSLAMMTGRRAAEIAVQIRRAVAEDAGRDGTEDDA